MPASGKGIETWQGNDDPRSRGERPFQEIREPYRTIISCDDAGEAYGSIPRGLLPVCRECQVGKVPGITKPFPGYPVGNSITHRCYRWNEGEKQSKSSDELS